jgi:hypothetical protein
MRKTGSSGLKETDMHPFVEHPKYKPLAYLNETRIRASLRDGRQRVSFE